MDSREKNIVANYLFLSHIAIFSYLHFVDIWLCLVALGRRLDLNIYRNAKDVDEDDDDDC